MDTKEYLDKLKVQLSYLYSFARQMNELDFAASLCGEFRGMQDAGWSTTITAHEVFEELNAYAEDKTPRTKAQIRTILMLYCQLAEAGGVYETIKNIMGVITLKPYLLWPFKDLVRVKKGPHRVIGPNANATFRDLATTARDIGLSHLSSLLENTFRDDIRNGIYHADYVIWNDGLRLRNRNGGNATKISFEEIESTVTRAVAFFYLLIHHNDAATQSFNPPKTIVGRLSANFPMPWTVHFDPDKKTFSISGCSPGPQTNPEYERQMEINARLGGKVLSVYTAAESTFQEEVDKHIMKNGFEPNYLLMTPQQLDLLACDVDKLNLWDQRHSNAIRGLVLLASPWGFRWLYTLRDFDSILPKPIVDLELAS